MKNSRLLVALICFLTNFSFGQDSTLFFFDEFHISVNRTTVKDENTIDRNGFGLGAYHSFRSDKKMNLVVGFEYNRTSQFKKRIYNGHFANMTDVTYNLNYLSIPVGFRFNFGTKTKFFIESGGFADIILKSSRSGTYHTYLPDENDQLQYAEGKIDEEADLSNTVGIHFGVGVRIPISKFEIIIKPEYKCALNPLYSYLDSVSNRYFRINIGLKIN